MTREKFITHVEREQESLRGFLLALCCGNRDDADDLAQDALVKAYLSSSGYQDQGKFHAWLFRIAHITDTSEDAVKKQLSRGRDKLRPLLNIEC